MKNQRFPFLDLQNKKSTDTENPKIIQSSSKHQSSPTGNYISQIGHQSKSITSQPQQKLLNIQIVKEPSTDPREMMSRTEEEMGEEEYKLCLKKALKESFEENDQLRQKIQDISQENKEIKQDLEEKESALLELAQFYEYCQQNHLHNTHQAITDEKNDSNSKEGKRKQSF